MSVSNADIRIRLKWFRLKERSGGVIVVTPIDGEKEGLGLGKSGGIQHYRDALGRVGVVPVAWFDTNTVRIPVKELPSILPEMSQEDAAKRFFANRPVPSASVSARPAVAKGAVARPKNSGKPKGRSQGVRNDARQRDPVIPRVLMTKRAVPTKPGV